MATVSSSEQIGSELDWVVTERLQATEQAFACLAKAAELRNELELRSKKVISPGMAAFGVFFPAPFVAEAYKTVWLKHRIKVFERTGHELMPEDYPVDHHITDNYQSGAEGLI